MKCIVCKREKIFDGEGRIIDGSWIDDGKIEKKYRLKWVCSFPCYRKLLETEKKEVKK